MNSYRKQANELHSESWWTLKKFVGIFVAVVVFLSVLGFTLNSLGLIGGTAVQRVVFEQSFQRSESMKARIAADKAALAEVEARLSNPNLDQDTRYNLEAQARAMRIRIATAEEMK